ncbi:hypothetical protein QA861_11845 [Streptomyces sp. B21-083]
MVDVQFGLGQPGDEGVRVTDAGCGPLVVVGQGFLPGNGAPDRATVGGTRVIG